MENDVFAKSFEPIDTIEKEIKQFVMLMKDWYEVENISISIEDKDGLVYLIEK